METSSSLQHSRNSLRLPPSISSLPEMSARVRHAILQVARPSLAFLEKDYWRIRSNNPKIQHCKILPGTLKEPLGEGGYGHAYKVRAIEIFEKAPPDEFVVVKGINRNLIRNKNSQEKEMGRLIKEGLKLAEIEHENITKVFAIDYDQGFIVIEYAANGDAFAYKQRKSLGVKLDVLLDTIKGLAALHEHHIVHGDVKADNIFIDCKGRAKLGDLGTAKTGFTNRPFQGKLLRGTRAMMPPELIQSTEKYKTHTAACDIWSFGMMMADILFGDRIFKCFAPKNKKLGHRFRRIEHYLKHTGPDRISAYFQSVFNEFVEEMMPFSQKKHGLKALFSRCIDPDPCKRISASDYMKQLADIIGIKK